MNIKQIVSEMFRYIRGNYQLPVIEKQVYSEAEMVVGVWTDGKPLYRKTIVFNNVTINKTQQNIGELPSDIDYGVVKEVMGEHDGYNEGIGKLAVWIRKPDNNFGAIIIVGDQQTYTSLYVTIEYTKTTDTPTQTKVPLEPLIEYSTDEKFIGYWIDGKPMYRKTFTGQSIRVSKDDAIWTQIATIDGIDKIIDAKFYAFGDNSNMTLTSCREVNVDVQNHNVIGHYFGYSRTITDFILVYTKTTDTP